MSNAMIVAPQPDAVATGAIVLKVESNAVDAAIYLRFRANGRGSANQYSIPQLRTSGRNGT